MRNEEHTIESGLHALLGKAKYHRDEADRFDRLAISFREAEVALRNGADKLANSVGRPVDEKAKKTLVEAIDIMPTEFTLTELKEAAKGMKLDVFRRLFRDIRADGVVKEKVKAMGRREGVYTKNGQAALP